MSNVSDTVARILANVDGETKAESVSFEDRVEVLDQVAAELTRRADHWRPTLELMREDVPDARGPRERAVTTPADQDLGPDHGTGDDPDGNGIASGPHGRKDKPVVSQGRNTPATKVEPGAISMAGSEKANDL